MRRLNPHCLRHDTRSTFWSLANASALSLPSPPPPNLIRPHHSHECTDSGLLPLTASIAAPHPNNSCTQSYPKADQKHYSNNTPAHLISPQLPLIVLFNARPMLMPEPPSLLLTSFSLNTGTPHLREIASVLACARVPGIIVACGFESIDRRSRPFKRRCALCVPRGWVVTWRHDGPEARPTHSPPPPAYTSQKTYATT